MKRNTSRVTTVAALGAAIALSLALAEGGGTPTASAQAQPTNTPAPTPTTLPVVESDSTRVQLTHIDIPPIAGTTLSTDALAVDQSAHLLFVTDRGDMGIDVLDVSSPTAKYVRTVDLGTGPNGVVAVSSLQKAFTGNNDSSVSVIDTNPRSATYLTVVAKIPTGGAHRTDLVEYDSKDRKVFAANGDDGFVTVINAATNTVIGKIDNLGDGLEQPLYDSGDGMLYLNSSAQNAILQIDPVRDVLLKKTDLGVPCSPNGLAINPTSGMALLACGATAQPQHVLVWDLKANKLANDFNQVGAADITLYVPRIDRFLVGAGNFYRGGQIGVFGGTPVRFLTNVPTLRGTSDVAYDETNRVVYTKDPTPNSGGLLSFVLPASVLPVGLPATGDGSMGTSAASGTGTSPWLYVGLALLLVAAGGAVKLARSARRP